MRHYQFNLNELNFKCLEERSKEISIVTEFDDQIKEEVLQIHLAEGASKEKVEVGFNYLYIETPKNKVLIDAGSGTGQLVNCMKAANIDPLSIDSIIITHADSDHVNGLHEFPNATIYLAHLSWKMWTNKASRDRLNEEFKDALGQLFDTDVILRGIDGRNEFGTKILPNLKERLVLVNEQESFLSYFKMIYTPGHRSDHFAIKINSKPNELIVIADAFRHSFQFNHLDYPSHYDSHAEPWKESLKSIKGLDPDKTALYFGNHISFPGLLHYDKNILVKKD